MKKVQFVGLDVHAETIAVAVAEPGGVVRSVGVIPNRPESIRRLVKQLGSPEHVRACYEAGRPSSRHQPTASTAIEFLSRSIPFGTPVEPDEKRTAQIGDSHDDWSESLARTSPSRRSSSSAKACDV